MSKLTELKTERLLLRKLKKSDWKAVSFLRSDEEINKFVKRASAKTKKEALEFISKINAQIEEGIFFYWAITENNNDEMIGSVCLWNFSKDKKIAEIGFDLSPKFQGKGIMTESLKCIIQFGFEKLNLDLVEAYTNISNQKSKSLLEKNNFEFVAGKKDEHNLENVIYELKSD